MVWVGSTFLSMSAAFTNISLNQMKCVIVDMFAHECPHMSDGTFASQAPKPPCLFACLLALGARGDGTTTTTTTTTTMITTTTTTSTTTRTTTITEQQPHVSEPAFFHSAPGPEQHKLRLQFSDQGNVREHSLLLSCPVAIRCQIPKHHIQPLVDEARIHPRIPLGLRSLRHVPNKWCFGTSAIIALLL